MIHGAFPLQRINNGVLVRNDRGIHRILDNIEDIFQLNPNLGVNHQITQNINAARVSLRIPQLLEEEVTFPQMILDNAYKAFHKRFIRFREPGLWRGLD